jgi:3-methyladenine DNA glycosylase Tag
MAKSAAKSAAKGVAKVTFKRIRERAIERKGGETVLASLMPKKPNARAVARLTDDRVLSEMAARIFSAGFVWSVIDKKWPGFEEAFLDFNPKRLLFQPAEFWEKLDSDKRIVRHPQKIRSVRDNARFVSEIAAEHGSFGKFLATWPVDDQAGLLDLLGKRGARLGGFSGQYLLRFLGWDAFVLSGHVLLCLRDAGVPLSATGTSKKDLRAAQAQLNAWKQESGLPMTHVSRICALSIGENYDVARLKEILQQ